MNKTHLFVLALVLSIIGFGLFFYKVVHLSFPVLPEETVKTWKIEARIRFVGKGGPAKVSLFIPTSARNYALMDERFVSGGFGLVAGIDHGHRKAVWSIREAEGKQTLYYQADIARVRSTAPPPKGKKPEPEKSELNDSQKKALQAVLKKAQAQSADVPTLVSVLLKQMTAKELDENERILVGTNPTPAKRMRAASKVLNYGGITARPVRGIRLREEKVEFTRDAPLLSWIEVYHQGEWMAFNPMTGAQEIPDNWFPWWTGTDPMVRLEGGDKPETTVSVAPKEEAAVSAAARRGLVTHPWLLKYSLFSLPVNTQAVYRIMLLVPIGALLLVLLRNMIGIKTFGTFMPVLIALSFRETGLLRGIVIFTLLVVLGLAVRFYLERLKLLLVPRLAAVLIVVVLTMAALSIVTHKMGGNTGLSVALFPLVILTMTIERMSIVWEERGASEAIVSGVGSLFTAALAFIVMNLAIVEHLVFVFPELLLVVLALTLLTGRYTGYRLTDLHRFREFAKE